MSINRFFHNNIASAGLSELDYTILDVGGCPFKSLSVTLIDHIKDDRGLPEDGFDFLIKWLQHYFPNYALIPQASSLKQLRSLIFGRQKYDVIECISFVLRQIAIDEILTRPLNYIEVFAHCNPHASVESLRDTGTLFSPSILKAIALLLNLKITLSVEESDKELRRRVSFTAQHAIANVELIIPVINGQSYANAKMKNFAEFLPLANKSMRASKPIQVNTAGSIWPVITIIKDYLAAERLKVEKYRDNLHSLVEVEELSKNQLIDLYCQFLPRCDSCYYEGNFKVLPSPNYSKRSKCTSIEVALINVIAQWLGSGLVDPDQFYEAIENPNTKLCRVAS